MSVNYVTSNKTVPMIVVGDHKYVTDHIRGTNSELSNSGVKFNNESIDTVALDPGGMYCTELPHAKFSVDGVKFDVQYTKVADTITLVESGKERVPGYMRFPMWRWLVIMPKDLQTKLLVKLYELTKSDEEMHAQLTEFEILQNLEANTSFRSRRIPRERSE